MLPPGHPGSMGIVRSMASHLTLQALYIGLEAVMDVVIVWERSFVTAQTERYSDASALELYKIARPFSSV